MKSPEKVQNAATKEDNEVSSESEDSDSYSDQSCSDTTTENNSCKQRKQIPQFSVLRSESDGLRMKISAIRNLNEILDGNNKCTSNNNNDINISKNDCDKRSQYQQQQQQQQQQQYKRQQKQQPQHQQRQQQSKKQNQSRLLKSKRRISTSVSSSSCCSACSRSDESDSSSDTTAEKTKKVRLRRRKSHNVSGMDRKITSISKDVTIWHSSDINSKKSSVAGVKNSEIVEFSNSTKKNSSVQNNEVLPTDCLSSSDTELPALVSAAIKCVESSSEIENSPSNEPPHQYNSTLLQDFMIKTQMLGSCVESGNLKTKENAASSLHCEEKKNSTTSVDVLTKPLENKKKRGRPKKSTTLRNNPKPVVVNESVDSGITSTAQSLSPSPNSQRNKEVTKVKPSKVTHPPNGLTDHPKETTVQKLSIVNLEKQMYATERILYPPRGRKKSVGKTRSKVLKCDLDPMWKKIDVNSKFHRPILTGYKSDGGSTVCSKVLTGKCGGYVSDYGASRHKNYSGYKSDRSGKSRCSMKSYASRAKSCDYRSDYSSRSRKSRRKKRSQLKHSVSSNSVNEQDILLLASLSLGQTSDESNQDLVDKTSEANCSSKKYGEINRFIRTGEYFGGLKKNYAGKLSFISNNNSRGGAKDGLVFGAKAELFAAKVLPPNRSSKLSSMYKKLDYVHEMGNLTAKMRFRRPSAVSRCSSVSAVSKYNTKRRKRRKLRARSQNRCACMDPKLDMEVDTLTISFLTQCRIEGEKSTYPKEKAEKDKHSGSKSSSSKRSQKKRKLSENIEHLLSSSSIKRRHKKSGQNSPDEHKLPLKKRHYLLTPGEKSEGKSMHIADTKTKELSDSKYLGKSVGNNNTKVPSKAITPKKRHLLETPQNCLHDSATGLHTRSNASPSLNEVKPVLKSPERLNDSTSSKNHIQVKSDIITRKKNRLEGLVSKIQSVGTPLKIASPDSSDLPTQHPQPGIFEPTVELEIQIPNLNKYVNSNIITKSEVDSPKTVADNTEFDKTNSQPKSERVVETLLHKTGGHLYIRKKRRKMFNRTGFPTVRKRKRKLPSCESKPQLSESESKSSLLTSTQLVSSGSKKATKINSNKTEILPCDRVPHPGETSDTFLERNKQPRLSVVSLDRLQEPNKKIDEVSIVSQTDANSNISVSDTMKRNRSSLTRKRTHNCIEVNCLSSTKSERTKVESKSSLETAASSEVKESEATIETVPTIVYQSTKISSSRRNVNTAHKEETIADCLHVNNLNKVNKNKNSNSLTSIKKALKATKKIEHLSSQKSLKMVNNLKSNNELKKSYAEVVKIKKKYKEEEEVDCQVDSLMNKKTKLHGVGKNSTNSKKFKTAFSTVAIKSVKQERTSECASDESLEQEPLPLNENFPNSEEVMIMSDSSGKSKKITKWKKKYLTAGLFSNTFKEDKPKRNPKDKIEKLTTEMSSTVTNLLPPPPYCEKYFRRTQQDFVLPYDVWWAHINSKLISKNTVPSWNYKKIRTNVYNEIRPNPVVDPQVCNCKSQSACGDDCLNRMVYTECSPAYCPCADKCLNQKIQKHETVPGIERFMTVNKGWGVRTTQPIKKGTYILEYVGEVVNEKEFKDRMATLYVNDTHHYCLHLDGGLVIDGHRMGSDGRFVNHSCSPNCEMQKWSVNGLSRMALFAMRNIDGGEELTYDYNFSLFNPSEGQPCRCDTPQCRGVIGGKSQRVKPLEQKAIEQVCLNRHSRARKRQAKKNSGRFQSKDLIIPQFQLPSDREKKIIKGNNCFLIRNLEKIGKHKYRSLKSSDMPTRPLTPSSIAAQISALRVPRNIKTRGLTQAAHDPEVERMAKMAVIFREICIELESIKDNEGKSQISKLLPASKKRRTSQERIKRQIDFPTVQANVEKGFYKEAETFDEDVNKVFSNALHHFGPNSEEAKAVDDLTKFYAIKKLKVYDQLAKLVTEKSLRNFRSPQEGKPATTTKKTEDIIRCICGLFKDEGLMIQCAKCMVWQHAECTKADVKADKYMCDRCENRQVDLEIPLDEFHEDGYRYYLSLLRGKLQIRQGDTVYVLRDIPIKDLDGKVYATKKHTYETIGDVDFSECDIFRVERLWKDDDGKRFVFGHHYLRPHETFHEPTRKFYENEVIRVPLYEVVPIELVIARCWVFDRNTFCKGRPVDCISEQHVYICELRVDKSARFFSKVKQSYPTCTKEYAFRSFKEKLKISRTYAPHEIDPSFIKTKKRKEDTMNPTPPRKNSCPIIQLLPPPPKTVNEKRCRIENILTILRTKLFSNTDMPALDLSYLLTGRRARQRKANAVAAMVPL